MLRRIFLKIAGGALTTGALGMTGRRPVFGETSRVTGPTDPIDAATFHAMRRFARSHLQFESR